MSTSLLRCPICAQHLDIIGRTYKCPSGHSYDIAKEGYVNLLPANKKHSASPGDDSGMALSRSSFLSKGYYAPLCKELCRICEEFSADAVNIVDSGCGEGYYSQSVFAHLTEKGCRVSLAGVDLSKPSLKKAGRRCPQGEFALASVYHMPICDGAADILINCFSPLAQDEFRRVLRAGGIFIYVVPAARHLWQLKQVLYEKPYENAEEKIEYPGFEYIDVRAVDFSMQLDNAALEEVFRMTPYYWKTPREGAQRLSEIPSLEVEASFRVHIFRRTEELSHGIS
jgi:23S rRNA (guanine745-N1)-methyltransferase